MPQWNKLYHRTEGKTGLREEEGNAEGSTSTEEGWDKRDRDRELERDKKSKTKMGLGRNRARKRETLRNKEQEKTKRQMQGQGRDREIEADERHVDAHGEVKRRDNMEDSREEAWRGVCSGAEGLLLLLCLGSVV